MPGKERQAAQRAGWRSRRPLGLRQLLLAGLVAALATLLLSGPALADGWFHGPQTQDVVGT